jgi:hypothetical protein
MPAHGDASDKAAESQDPGGVALLPEPFEVNAEAVACAARAARDVLATLSVSRRRRPARAVSPPAALLDLLPVVPKAD